MRDRLVALLVGVTIALVTSYGVPRAYMLANLVQDQQEHEVERSVELIAAALSAQEAAAVPVTESSLERLRGEDELLTYAPADGAEVTVGAAAPRESDLVRTAAVAGGGEVTVARSGDVVSDRVADAILPLVLIGLALLAASALAGAVLARRFSRPFQELADAATALGEGRFDRDVPHYAIPEAEEIATALRKSSAQLDQLVRREREFTVNASHELLTPITALNLVLEDLRTWPETPPSVVEELDASLVTLERLGTTVQGYLAHDRSTRRSSTVEVDLSALTRHVVARWRSESVAQRRDIRIETPGVIPAKVSPDEFTQVLDALLDNALRHGKGTVLVDCAEVESHLRVRVADESPSVGHSNVIHRQGPGPAAGLARVAEIAEAQGGFLVRDEHSTTRFVLMLPKPAV